MSDVKHTEEHTETHECVPKRTETHGDTVSREDAIETVRSLQTYKLAEGDDMLLVDLADVQTELMMMPSAEPERHGRWIIRDNPGTGWFRITCSECGEDVTSTAPTIGFMPECKVLWDYCPDCGSYNGGEQE